jgi:broad specificity phosphatase PhoE
MTTPGDLRMFVARHAESEANADGTLDTRAPGGPLTARGIEQARKLAKTMRKLRLKDRVAAIYSSPFLRTKQTAEIVAETLGFSARDVLITEKIKELYWGDLDGTASADLTSKEMTHFMEEVARGNYLHRLGTNGENQLELLKRLYEFLAETWGKHKGQTIVVVTHSTIATVLQKIVLHALRKEEKHKSLGNAEFCDIAISESNMRKINERKQILEENTHKYHENE